MKLGNDKMSTYMAQQANASALLGVSIFGFRAKIMN
jgi:hypothetical protein